MEAGRHRSLLTRRRPRRMARETIGGEGMAGVMLEGDQRGRNCGEREVASGFGRSQHQHAVYAFCKADEGAFDRVCSERRKHFSDAIP